MTALWKDGKHYPGKILELYGKFAYFMYDDGYKRWLPITDIEPIPAAAPDPVETTALKNGEAVIALWDNGAYYPGTVSDRYGKLVLVQYEDGDTGWSDSSTVKLKKDMLMVPWGRETQPFPAQLVEIYGKVACVRFFNNTAKWIETSKLSMPQNQPDYVSDLCPLTKGQKVYARWDDGKFYPGTVEEEYGKLVLVRFDDSDAGWALAFDCHKV